MNGFRVGIGDAILAARPAAETFTRANYLLRPEKGRGSDDAQPGVVADGRGQPDCRVGHAARVLILTRLWVKTPCPHQVRAPWMPVNSVRFQP
jgi:hypothetical protein